MEAITTISTINLIDMSRIRQKKTFKKKVNPFLLPDKCFKYKYRFNKSTARYIISLVYDQLKQDPRGGAVSPELQVLTALRCWGRREVQDDCADLHGLSQPTVSRICSRVAKAIAQLASTFIKMPETVTEERSCMTNFESLAGFPGVTGAIDCTHIKIKKTGGDAAQYYINRKGYYSLNVQVVCDAKLVIRDVVARWRGSTHDSRIFTESIIKERFNNGHFRGRLLGDSGYPLLPYLFTPILHPVCRKEERYNSAHIKTRNSVERCFGVWKQRFQCLLHGLSVSLENGKAVIVALAVLHNIAMSRNDDILEYENLEEVTIQSQHQIDEGMGNGAVRRHSRYILDTFIQNNF
ncbi:putative nuclease HARBI1 [Achroia grisella]|uniref:putative nuclease HARBI1 n=1 Tax=Achroia grisella TaxID=688607 RepID=UPI0027D32AC5|nr:putative nuclease HARBI1 [Achroia grisella]